MDQSTLQAVFGQPPRKAIEYLQQKKVMPSEDWWRVQADALFHGPVLPGFVRGGIV